MDRNCRGTDVKSRRQSEQGVDAVTATANANNNVVSTLPTEALLTHDVSAQP